MYEYYLITQMEYAKLKPFLWISTIDTSLKEKLRYSYYKFSLKKPPIRGNYDWIKPSYYQVCEINRIMLNNLKIRSAIECIK